VGTIYVFTAQILTSLVVSGYQNGLFAASFRIFIVIAAVPGLLAGAALPVLARAARDDRARLAYALQRMFQVSLIVGVAGALGALAGAGFMIAVVAGPKFSGAVGVLQIQGFALLASFLLAPWGYVLLSLRRHRGLLLANASALAVSATLTLLLAHGHGARGAAVATVCGESTLAMGYLLALLHAGREYRPPLAPIGKVLVAGAPAIALALVGGIPSLPRTVAVLALYGLLIVAVRAVPGELAELLPARLRRAR
jgi:O-antigen/teichoic acid export membrane protein